MRDYTKAGDGTTTNGLLAASAAKFGFECENLEDAVMRYSAIGFERYVVQCESTDGSLNGFAVMATGQGGSYIQAFSTDQWELARWVIDTTEAEVKAEMAV